MSGKITKFDNFITTLSARFNKNTFKIFKENVERYKHNIKGVNVIMTKPSIKKFMNNDVPFFDTLYNSYNYIENYAKNYGFSIIIEYTKLSEDQRKGSIIAVNNLKKPKADNKTGITENLFGCGFIHPKKCFSKSSLMIVI